MKVVFAGAGAAAIACANLYITYGVKLENILMVDRTGVIWKGRKENMNPYKERFARDTKKRTIAEALEGADAFVGVSAAKLITGEMIKKMAKDPIIFAMANPVPEITPEEAKAARPDVIMATGRSDYPNKVNNVLGFPFIFRGALDCRATQINEAMKLAASKALADLAKEDVPDSVARAYGVEGFKFGREYLIPKPFDWRVLLHVAPAVAAAAAATGVAKTADQGPGGVPAEARGHALAFAFVHAGHPRKGEVEPEADRPGRGRPPEDPARGQDPRRGGHRLADPPLAREEGRGGAEGARREGRRSRSSIRRSTRISRRTSRPSGRSGSATA